MDIFLTHARALLAKIAQSGWRPLFGWGGGLICIAAMKFAYIDAPVERIGLSDAYYTGLNVLIGLFIGAFIARGVEKQLDARAPIVPGGAAMGPGAQAGAT